jgi:hypothetical protein
MLSFMLVRDLEQGLLHYEEAVLGAPVVEPALM